GGLENREAEGPQVRVGVPGPRSGGPPADEYGFAARVLRLLQQRAEPGGDLAAERGDGDEDRVVRRIRRHGRQRVGRQRAVAAEQLTREVERVLYAAVLELVGHVRAGRRGRRRQFEAE